MPRVFVCTDDPIKRRRKTLVDIQVEPDQLDDEESAADVFERLVGGLEDAAQEERRRGPRQRQRKSPRPATDYLSVPSG